MLVFPYCFWWEKKKLNHFSCNSVLHELFLRSTSMSQTTQLCLERGFTCCKEKVHSRWTLWDQSWSPVIGFQQHSGYFIGGACCRMSVSVEIFFFGRSDILKPLLFGGFCEIPQMCCTVEVYFIVWVHHLSMRTSRKSYLCEVTERSTFAGMEAGVWPALYKLSWIQILQK